MGKSPDKVDSKSPGRSPSSAHKAAQSIVQPVTRSEYDFLATLLEGKENIQRIQKKDPHGEALRTTGQMYENREYVAAYECFKPAYDKVVADMQRILARNVEFEANKLARMQQKPLALAKEKILSTRAHAQQVIDQFDRLLNDLQSKPLVRHHIKKGGFTAAAPAAEDAAPTVLNSAGETRLDADARQSGEVVSGDAHYTKAPYVPPAEGNIYLVRDKAKGERIIRVTGTNPDGALIDVETLRDGKPSNQPIQLTVESLARQAAKGWCSLLIPAAENEDVSAAASRPTTSDRAARVAIRLDSQNFSRCCADIVRANIKFGTQLIKDVADGPFRAGNCEQAFLTFEQLAVGFNSAVASSRRAIADGRRGLTAEKGKLSGKEIQERTAAFIRSEHLIHTAEREFATILEGLRMYLRAQQG